MTSALALAALIGAPAVVQSQVIVTTGDGNGADAFVSNDGQGGAYQYNEVCATDRMIMRDYPGVRLKISMLRFQIPTGYVGFSGSTFSLYNQWLGGTTAARPIEVWGLKDGDVGENWPEGSITFETAPGLIIGVTNGATWSPDPNRLVYLGQMPGATVEAAVYTDAPAGLADFLAADTDGLVTFYMTTIPLNSNGVEYETKDGTVDTTQWPTLTMPNAFPDPNYPDLTWAVGNGVWDVNTTANWNDGVGAAVYQEINSYGSAILLDDSASGSSPITITLDVPVAPRSITNNSTKDYTITGAGGGAINGGTGLTKFGSGTLTLSNVFNNFEGPVSIYSGTVAFSASALGGLTSALLIDGGTLRYLGLNAEDISTRSTTIGSAGATIDVAEAGNYVSFSAPFGGASAGGLTKTGPGTLALNGTHTYTGNTVVSGGTLAIGFGSLASAVITINSGATLDVQGLGSLVLTNGQTLNGNGTNAGGVTVVAGASLAAGTSAGTLTITGDLTMDGGTNVVDISTNLVGRDKLIVQGSIYLNSGRFRLVPATVLTNGVYPLIQYSGLLIGAAGSIFIDGFSQPGQVAFLSDANAGRIDLVIAPLSSKSLVWAGDGAVNAWDVGTTANWLDGVTPSPFNHGDGITFNDNGSNTPDIALGELVFPSSVSVTASQDYRIYDSTFVGGGKMAGTVGLTKSGAGKVTIDTPNSNSGATVINAGTVETGPGGSLGSGAITNNGSLIFGQNGNGTHTLLTGSGNLTVQAGGTITFATGASHSGPTTINSGTLQIGNGGAISPLATSAVVNNGTLALNTSDNLALPTSVTGTGGVLKRGAGSLTLNGGSYTGATTIDVNGGSIVAGAANVVNGTLTVQAGGRFDMNGFNQSIQGLTSTTFAGGVVTNSAATTNILTTTVNTAADASVALHGPVQLVKLGTAELLLRSDANTYSGGTIVGEGTLQGRGGSGSGFFGTGPITLRNNVTFQYDNFPGNELRVVAGASATLLARALGDAYVGPIVSGDSTSTLVIGNALSMDLGTAEQFAAFTGTVLVSSNAGAEIRFSRTTLTVNGGSLTRFKLEGAGLIHTRNGTAEDEGNGVFMGSLEGAPESRLEGATSQNRVTRYVIGGNNLSTVYAGTVGLAAGGGNPVAIMKVGTGTLTLSGTNRTEGTTRVDAGTLVLTGAEGNPTNTSAVVANATGILDVTGLTDGTLYLGRATVSGDGTINGNVSVDPASLNVVTIAPGNSTGVLTINGTLTLAASSVVNMELDRNGTPTADQLAATTLVANGATLNVTNLGPNLITDDVYQLFSGPVTGFGAVNLPVATADNSITYVWENNLAVDGTIRVVSGASPVDPTPTTIESSVVGNVLELSWPSTHTGWTLQTQTNALSVGLNGTWFDVAGSESTNQVFLPIDPANPTVFYRLTLPQP